MKESFTDNLRLSNINRTQLLIINKIIEEYKTDGYVLTLRQLYYQLVSRSIIPNQQKEYAKLSILLRKGRMAGIVDWDAIEDRTRQPILPYYVTGIDNAIQDTIDQYRLNRQHGQKNYIELWVEKDALSGVLKRITFHYHIRLMVNRGYSSCSAMHDSYKRYSNVLGVGKNIVILYLGDHDPSGLDMLRDVKERLIEFGLNYFEPDDLEEAEDGFTIKHIGLTSEQIKKYNPPPNPAKFSDPRANWYINQYGRTCWEVDALNPKVLNELVSKNIEYLIDMEIFNAQVKQEETDKEKLSKFTEVK